MKKNVFFHSADAKVTLRDRVRLANFINQLFKKEGKSLGTLSYVFCSDKYLLDINREFLQHNYYTDIITFDLSTNGNQVEAEIYISVDRVRDNARSFSNTINNELHRVIFHGALHLCGYKDKAKKDQLEMRAAEDGCLGRYFK